MESRRGVQSLRGRVSAWRKIISVDWRDLVVRILIKLAVA